MSAAAMAAGAARSTVGGVTGLAPRYDLVIVGGGITGAGIFREAARAGVSVLLVEARDYASGTSGWSSKLVHGGLRYLKSGEFKLTAESVRERQRLLREAPDLVEPLRFVMPLYAGVKPGRAALRLGLWLYDRLGTGAEPSRWLTAAAALAEQPALLPTRLLGAMRYTDARTDDCRLVWRLIAQGRLDGGTARNYARVERLLTDASGRVRGVAVADADDAGKTAEIEARVVIDATGAWAGGLAGQPRGAPKLRPLRGSHLVFPHASLPLTEAVSWPHPRDGRPVFAYPWQGATLLGTTDLDHGDADLWEPRATVAEVRYQIEALHWLFPQQRLAPADALSSFAGVRPIVDDGRGGAPSSASRESALWQSPGLVGITGGKLTTFRVTARAVLRAAAPELPGLKLAADAAPLFTAETATEHAQAPRVTEVATRVREEVRHLDDLLLRRSRLGLARPDGAAAELPALLAACRAALGWDDARCADEVQRYRARIAAQHSVPAG